MDFYLTLNALMSITMRFVTFKVTFLMLLRSGIQLDYKKQKKSKFLSNIFENRE